MDDRRSGWRRIDEEVDAGGRQLAGVAGSVRRPSTDEVVALNNVIGDAPVAGTVGRGGAEQLRIGGIDPKDLDGCSCLGVLLIVGVKSLVMPSAIPVSSANAVITGPAGAVLSIV